MKCWRTVCFSSSFFASLSASAFSESTAFAERQTFSACHFADTALNMACSLCTRRPAEWVHVTSAPRLGVSAVGTPVSFSGVSTFRTYDYLEKAVKGAQVF